MDQAHAVRSPLVAKDTFNVEYAPLKWRTVLGWEKDGIVKVIRIGRKCFLLRAELEQIIAEGGRQFANGWRRERAS
jgi:bifunctional DNA-binding transcriptional regulator/antitoxin component of YhaV-PrlF toxin-antitoxin module